MVEKENKILQLLQMVLLKAYNILMIQYFKNSYKNEVN